MADDDVAPSAPPLPDADVFGAASAPSYSEFYERQLQLREQDTSCDEAIARALAAETAGPPPPDTSLDAALALQLHSDEADRLCGHAPPGSWGAEADGVVRRALQGLRLLKLVPRLNPCPAPPPASAAARDRARLRARLELYGLRELEVAGDGNCQFRALSDQLYGSPAHHLAVRAAVARQLASAPARYAGFVVADGGGGEASGGVGGAYAAYVARAARPGTWGDHVTLQAAADAYGVRVFLVTSFLDRAVIEISPAVESPEFRARALHLSFFAEVHYNSIRPAAPDRGAGGGAGGGSDDDERRRRWGGYGGGGSGGSGGSGGDGGGGGGSGGRRRDKLLRGLEQGVGAVKEAAKMVLG